MVMKNCVICEEPIKTDRGKHAVTCSKACSKTYERARGYIDHLWRRKLRKK